MNILDYILSSETLIHVANIFLLISFSAKSMLLLRGLNIVAGACFITYFLLPEEPLWASLAWNILFALVNLWRIWIAILERRPPVLTDEEQLLYQRVFSELTPQAYRKLLDQGQWENGLPPLMLIESGVHPDRLWMVADGLMEVRRSDGSIRRIEPGDFVGETAFLSRGPMAADVAIVEPVRFMSWATEALEEFMEQHPHVGTSVQRILGQCLVRKLNSTPGSDAANGLVPAPG